VLLGNGDGTFQPAATYSSGGGSISPFSSLLTVADVNGDGKPDLIVENSQCCSVLGGVLGVLLGNGDGTFQKVVTYKSRAGGNGTSVAVADVNGDRKLDVVATDQCASSNCFNKGLVEVLLGNGDGALQTAQTYDSGGFLTNSVAIADVNGNGRPDLVVANICADNAGVCAHTSVGVLLNNSQSSDTTPPVITLSATPKILWPPNGRLVPVTLSGTITDARSGVNLSSAAYSVTDEYGKVQPTGAITLGAGGSYSFTPLLQASRRGSDLDGRHYTITVHASDNVGNAASQASVVTVRHDQGN
jgi:hypothetical protein